MIQTPEAVSGAAPYTATRESSVRLLLCLILAATTLFVYRESLGHQFVTMDDYPYVVENVQLQEVSAGRLFTGRCGPFMGRVGFR